MTFFTQSPRQKRPLEGIHFQPVEVCFGDATQEFHIGLGAVAVPGNLAGVFHVQQQLGRLPLSVIAEPAIHFARQGIQLNWFQAYAFKLLEPILTASAAARQIYAPQGKLLQQGQTLLMQDFADTLAYLAAEGLAVFYQGEIAHRLVQDCQDQGGHLSLDDLRNYSVLERQPLSLSYRNRTLLTNPPPSARGAINYLCIEAPVHR
ncbi:gamma-glutamyltransferase [Neosynechococcus sphagnicola]|uniref:gamma-glutamyltransferase n=1 Tax=Neosynechococcus sphagnicola TaxID=1501145 RepID=UPI0023BADB87|nr:gamma-glutamyltransferase [Neosynechococcus sphagnicola]